jgi:hypothetical protein
MIQELETLAPASIQQWIPLDANGSILPPRIAACLRASSDETSLLSGVGIRVEQKGRAKASKRAEKHAFSFAEALPEDEKQDPNLNGDWPSGLCLLPLGLL